MTHDRTKKVALPGLIAASLFGALMSALIFALWAYGHAEAYCFFNPDIDTEYAPGFSEEAFAQTIVGMHSSDIELNVGTPLDVSEGAGGKETWWYSRDGKCRWGDFAWNGRAIVFSNAVVVELIRQIYYD